MEESNPLQQVTNTPQTTPVKVYKNNTKCCFKLSKKIKFILYHLFDSILLLTIQLIQGSVLNYFIYNHYKQYNFYILFGLDIFCSLVFIITLYASFIYLKYYIEHNEYPDKNFIISPKRFIHQFPTSKLGILPLSYISWLVYVIVLFFKVVIIFGHDLFIILNEHSTFTPQLLKLIIGLASVVFLLLVEGHNRLEVTSDRYNYVTSVCSKVGVEIFDSVSLLSVLMLDDKITEPYEQSVCLLAGINFLLPALSLYRLSLSDKLLSDFNRKYPVQLIHHFIRIFIIELPFLVVRLHLWITYEKEASMFMMKNIFNIIVTMRTIHPELVQYMSRDDPDGGLINYSHNLAI